MANTIQVTTTALNNKATNLKTYNSKLKSQIENLKTAESALNSMWDGEANDAFHKTFNQDIIQMTNFYNAIEKYIACLLAIIKEYERAERANQARGNKRKYR